MLRKIENKSEVRSPKSETNSNFQNTKLEIFLFILSAIGLIISFPGFNLWFLAWVSLVPLLFAVEGQKPFRAFLISYLAGVLFFLGTIWWLVHVTLPGMIVVALYLALYFGFFGLICGFFLHRTPECEAKRSLPKGDVGRSTRTYVLLFTIPAVWVALEYARAHLLTGFGWVLLAHSQSPNLPIIQIADMAGAYGVSFLVVLANAAIYLTIKNFNKKDYLYTHLAIAIFLIFLSASYGVFRLKNVFTGETLKVAVVQGNIPQDRKWDPVFKEEILQSYETLTKQAAGEKPDLIIWPETSIPGFLETEADLLDRTRALVLNIRTPLLVGTVREEDRQGSVSYYNSAVLFTSDGKIIDRYDKVHLVPFGEYIPFRKALSFVEKFAPIPIGDCANGKDYKVLNFVIERKADDANYRWRLVKKVKFSVLICFEDIFPEIASRFARNGAAFLVNITNDAWYKKTSAAYQHAQASVFRAVENRVNVVRAANTGLSCFIDQKGRIADSVSEGGRELFVKGYKCHDIILTGAGTIYALYGDVFACACILMTLFSVFIYKNYFRIRE